MEFANKKYNLDFKGRLPKGNYLVADRYESVYQLFFLVRKAALFYFLSERRPECLKPL